MIACDDRIAADTGTGYGNRSLPYVSCLYVRSLIGDSPFVISTDSHIFDAAIVNEVRHLEVGPASASAAVLVETDIGSTLGRPSTAVGVKMCGGKVSNISRELHGEFIAQPGEARIGDVIGIEAGLFVCSKAVLETLSELEITDEYFSLATALWKLSSEGSVIACCTAGRHWVAVETAVELERVHNEQHKLSLSCESNLISHELNPLSHEVNLNNNTENSTTRFVPSVQQRYVRVLSRQDTNSALHCSNLLINNYRIRRKATVSVLPSDLQLNTTVSQRTAQNGTEVVHV